ETGTSKGVYNNRKDKEKLAKSVRSTVKKWYRQTDPGSSSTDYHWVSTLLRRKPAFKVSTTVDDDEYGCEGISFVFEFDVRVSILGFYEHFQWWIKTERQARNGIRFQFTKGGVRLGFGHLKHRDKTWQLDQWSKCGQKYNGIDHPSVQLLAVHRAICHILHLSAAGNYIDSTPCDMDGGT
ncbi:hypothetical protein BHE90_017546, partial [Fusarium euwallaceae]